MTEKLKRKRETLKQKRPLKEGATTMSKYAKAFYLRADRLRPMFGHWDCVDPASHAILDVVEAQRDLSDAIAEEMVYCPPRGANAAIKAALERRERAAEKLKKVVNDREYRQRTLVLP
jgi:hypothetical protein